MFSAGCGSVIKLMIWLTLGLLVLGVSLLWRSINLRRSTGLPWRPIVYDDTAKRTLAKPLWSEQHRLTGKPDYVIQRGKALIPVEVKPTRRDQQPRTSDILQLAAYCLLLEEQTDIVPPFGILRYAEHSFQIDWTDDLYAELLATLDAMRVDRQSDDVPRSHDDQRRCRACGFADRCVDALN